MKCGKVKNPCKICFQSVSNKTGLRCKGACKKWAHFKCLNYTPGKICDIKAGLINISCPCPDCASEEDLAEQKNLSDTCSNQYCPRAKLSYESIDSSSKGNPIPQFENPPNVERYKSQERLQNSTQNKARKSPPLLRKSSLQDLPGSAPRRISSRPRSPTSPSKRPASPPRNQVALPRRPGSPQKCKTCKLPCPLHCPKRTSHKIITDKQLPHQRSQSSSVISSGSMNSDRPCLQIPRAFSSHDQKILFNTVEELCNTVGQLSNQIRGLMCTMMNALDNKKRS